MYDLELELHRVEMDKEIPKGRENRRTRGTLLADGGLFCHMLEDEVRIDNPSTPQDEGAKIKGKSAIPAGRYEVKLTYSPKYQKIMPLVDAVPGFTGIRIHSGHDETHTEGCLLTAGGFDKDGDIIGGSSKPAFEKVMTLLNEATRAGRRVWLTITNDFLTEDPRVECHR